MKIISGWKLHSYGYRWESLRAAYFKKYQNKENYELCKLLAQCHKSELRNYESKKSGS